MRTDSQLVQMIEGHVSPIEDEYQKSVGTKFRYCLGVSQFIISFYPRDAMLARVIVIATCLSVRPSVRPPRAGIVSKRRKLAS